MNRFSRETWIAPKLLSIFIDRLLYGEFACIAEFRILPFAILNDIKLDTIIKIRIKREKMALQEWFKSACINKASSGGRSASAERHLTGQRHGALTFFRFRQFLWYFFYIKSFLCNENRFENRSRKPINNVRKGTRISREAVFAVHSSDTNISTAFVSSQSTKLRALYSGTGTGTGTRFFPRSIVPCFRIYTFTVEMKLLLRSLASISVTHFLQIWQTSFLS